MNIVFSTGAGVSAESGISTFRDAGGLWEKYPVMQVASAEGFAANPELVHQFYNARRHDLLKAQPNDAHKLIAELQQYHNVRVITQNVDDLHERAGSRNVLHLHGELMKIRSIQHPDYIEALTPDNLDTTPQTQGRNGDFMRPHIVFFNEAVSNITPAMELAASADIFVVIGTSLNVYPAAGLVNCIRPGVPVYYIDPKPATLTLQGRGASNPLTVMPLTATQGMAKLFDILTSSDFSINL